MFLLFSAIHFHRKRPLRSLFRYKFNLSCHWLRLRLPLSGRHLSQALDILVSVRSIHCCTYTPDLSTSSSLRCLTRLLYERSHLKAGFTLRCFQRLSFPNVATQLYPWRDNWYTSGSSTRSSRTRSSPLQISLRPRWIGTELSHDVLNPAHVPL